MVVGAVMYSATWTANVSGTRFARAVLWSNACQDEVERLIGLVCEYEEETIIMDFGYFSR